MSAAVRRSPAPAMGARFARRTTGRVMAVVGYTDGGLVQLAEPGVPLHHAVSPSELARNWFPLPEEAKR